MPSKLALPALAAFVLAVTAGCGTMSEGTLVDFGPEPGTPGDPAHWHFQPQLHGPNAPPRDQTRPADRAAPAAAAPASVNAPAPIPGQDPASPMTPSAVPELPPPPPPPAVPATPVSETMFNDAIRRAVASGDIDRALRLLEEAERLGSTTARQTFIEALESR
jgi:hypothetical protein